MAANAPPITKRTVLVLTSLSFLKKKPMAKKAGKENNADKLDIVEKPFEKALSDPINEITKSKPIGIRIGSKDFLSFSMPKIKKTPTTANNAPARPKIWLIFPKLKAVKATTSKIKKVRMDLFLTKKFSFSIVSYYTYL